MQSIFTLINKKQVKPTIHNPAFITRVKLIKNLNQKLWSSTTNKEKKTSDGNEEIVSRERERDQARKRVPGKGYPNFVIRKCTRGAGD